MSLWFLDENEKPATAAGYSGGPATQPGAGPYQNQNFLNQPQGAYPGAQGYQQGHPLGQHPQDAQSPGEAASYFNADPGAPPPYEGTLLGPPPQVNPYNHGPPSISQDSHGQSDYGVYSPPHGAPPHSSPVGGQQPYGSQPYGAQPPYGAPSQPHGAQSFYGSQPPPGGMNQGYHTSFDGFQQQQQPVHVPERGLFSHNPLNPPPVGFQRPPPGHYTYAHFAPMSVYANTEKLQGGFQMIPPPARAGDQHPFASHDVTEEDWHKFLKDLEKTAYLSPTQRLGDFLKHNSRGVQERLKQDRMEPVGDYLLAWNQYFFQPRRMTVVLALGSQRYSGETEDAPPDLHSHHKSSKHSSSKRSGGSDSGSSSDSGSDHKHSGGHGLVSQRREDRRARRDERREKRRDKHGHKHSHKEETPQVHVSGTKFRLVVCFWDGSREVY